MTNYKAKAEYCPNEKCDLCPNIGAYDFSGDLICPECLKNIKNVDMDLLKH
jgi:hypothetical protein